ncbi:TetR/AcrR family transcriptional regulator [Pacificispira sp.]|uniref:TetR/AcrR family transcriptional regulator n=1 Tax=Pacificispira sp. TaxID=2888761 RepID=UPI003BA9C791
MAGQRKYVQDKRAEAKARTREKIVQAAMYLHRTIGPRGTTISAIAERAGVQRLTVYRHFPDENAIFQACTSRWTDDHPMPDPAAWQDIDPGPPRIRAALSKLYAYYDRSEQMLAAAARDEPDVPAIQEPMTRGRAAIADMADGLLEGWQPRPGDAETLHHAAKFRTWQSLNEDGLDDTAKINLVVEKWLAG